MIKSAFRKVTLPVQLIIHNTDLLKHLVGREVTQRFRGSYLGILWNFIMPLIMVSVYTFVFGYVFKGKWDYQVSDSMIEFALTLFSGIMVYNVFSEAVSASPLLIISNVNYVKRVVFPLEILSVANVAGCLVQMIFNALVILLGKLLVMHQFDCFFLFLPLVLMPLVFLALGFSWTLSAIGVYIRDIKQISSVLTLIFGYMTPIFYPLSAVPEALQGILRWNPLTTIVENARRVLIYHQYPQWEALTVVFLVSYGFMLLGLFIFKRIRPSFADMV